MRVPKIRLLEKQQIPIEAHRAQVSVIGTALPWVSIAYGITMPIGGNGRWQGHSLESVMVFSDAAIVYGTVLLVAGMLMAIGQLTDVPSMIFIGAWVCGFWYVIAALATLGQAVFDHDSVYLAGTVSWGFLALNCIVTASQRIDHSAKPVETPSSSQNQ